MSGLLFVSITHRYDLIPVPCVHREIDRENRIVAKLLRGSKHEFVNLNSLW